MDGEDEKVQFCCEIQAIFNVLKILELIPFLTPCIYGTLSEFMRLEVHLTLSLCVGGGYVKSFSCLTKLWLS